MEATTTAGGVAPTFSGVSGGSVLIAVGGVPGYAVTTLAAQVTEPFVRAGNVWPISIDLDALNPNVIAVATRGLPTSVTTLPPSDLANALRIDVTPSAGSRLLDTTVGGTVSGLTHSFGDEIAVVGRSVTAPTLAVGGSVINATVHVPAGAASWRVAPALSSTLAGQVLVKGASDATAVFTGTPTVVPLPVTFRYVPSNALVKSLTGTITRPDGSTVAGATVVVSRAGGLSVSTVSSVDGAFGPVALEAGEYVVAPVASPGADWIPALAGRVTFAGDDQAGDAEQATVSLVVEPAGGILQGRLTKFVSSGVPELTTGTVVLQGDGHAITAKAAASVLPGQDASTGANFSVQGPSGAYVMSVIPDDSTRTPPPSLLVRLVDGRVSVVAPADLPPLDRTLAHVDGLVRLSSGSTLANVVVQARLDGIGTVVPATTDANGRYRLSLEPGTWTVAPTVSPGTTFMPGNQLNVAVASLATLSLSDLILPVASATIERTLVKGGNDPSSVAFTDAEASEIAGTAFVKDEESGIGTSVAFQGARIRVAVPEGRYRLSIAIHAGGFLAPEAETGVVAAASSPNVATRVVGAMGTHVTGRLVNGQTSSSAGTPVAIRSVIRAAGVSGAAAGTLVTSESKSDGAFAFNLAPGVWRLSASPGSSSGYLVNANRPWVDVTVGVGGAVTPSAIGIDLVVPTRTVTGSVVSDVGGVLARLVGVRVTAEVLGATGGVTSVSTETGPDGTFGLRLPSGVATLSVTSANARFATAGQGHAAGDPAYVVDPVPSGAPSVEAPITISVTTATATVSGAVSGNGSGVGGATVVATLRATGQSRVTTSFGGARSGQWALRLSPGTWSIVASVDLALDSGLRVPAMSSARDITVASDDIANADFEVIAGAVTLPPAASAPASPAAGGMVRAGLSSAEIRIAPGAVAEPVTVTVEPVGNAPTLPGYVPFGDAFRLSAVTSAGIPVTNLAVDSPLLITYSRSVLSSKRAPTTATHGQATAQPADLRPARFDSVTGSYTAILGAVASDISSVTGLFTAPTLTLGTFVLTSREVLVEAPVPPPPANGGGGGAGGGGGGSVRPVAKPVTTPTTTTRASASVVAIETPTPAPTIVATTIPAPRVPAWFVPTGAAGSPPVTVIPVIVGTLGDGRFDAHVVAPPGGVPVIVPVDVLHVVTVEIPADGAVVAFVVSQFAGLDGGSVVARVSSSLMSQILRVTPGSRTALRFDPAPPLSSDAQRGFLGGGNVVPIGSPVDLRLETRDAAGLFVDLGALRTTVDGVSSAPSVDVAVPVPDRFVGSDATYACLVGLYEPGLGGGFLGYGRLPAPYDAASVSHVLTIDVDGLMGTLLLPSQLRVAYVSNFDPDAHLWSNPTSAAIDLGPIGGPTTPMRVVGPQVGRRIFVSNPRTGGVGWVDASAVGPEDPAKANLPLLPPSEPVTKIPDTVKTSSATVHVYAHEGPDAIDFGLVGPAGTVLTVIGPALDGRVFVFNPVTENYGWVNLAEVVTLDGTPVGQAIPLTPAIGTSTPAAPVVLPKNVKTTSATVHVYAHEGPSAADFGLVGPAGTVLTVIGPALDGRVFVFNPVTENYGWVNLAEVVTLDGTPVGQAIPLTPAIGTSTPAAPVVLPKNVKTTSATVHVYAHEGPSAADFGLVGPAGTVLTVIGPALDGRIFVFNPVTENYGWVNLAEVVTLDGTPLGQSIPPKPSVGTAAPATSTAPVVLPKNVKTTSTAVHVYAHEGPSAADFGLVGPAGTVLTVIGPALDGRVFVFSPVTENYGWVNLAEVVTLDGGAIGQATPAQPASKVSGAPVLITLPKNVKTLSPTAHVFAHEGPDAIDFGPVGPTGTVLTVTGPALAERIFVFNPVTENYGWVNLAEMATLDGAPLVGNPNPASASSTRVAPATATQITGEVVTVRAGVHLWSNATPTAIDFGEIGPTGARLVLVGPREGARAFVINPATESVAWVDLDAISAPGR